MTQNGLIKNRYIPLCNSVLGVQCFSWVHLRALWSYINSTVFNPTKKPQLWRLKQVLKNITVDKRLWPNSLPSDQR